MAHPMFTVPTESSQSQQKKKAQVHLLPCRIHHDGAVGSTETYWNPVEGEGENHAPPPPPSSSSVHNN